MADTTIEGRTARARAGAATTTVSPIVLASERLLPVAPPLRPLFGGGGLQRGTSVAVLGSTSLAVALVATASSEGSWVAAVGMPALGMAAVAEMGVDLERFVLVAPPSEQRWPTVVASLVDALDVVLIAPPPGGEARRAAERLRARARERGSVLVVTGDPSWPADLRLRVIRRQWHGLGRGHGHLQWRETEVAAEGRGPAAGERRTTLARAG